METQYYTKASLLVAFVVGILVGFGGYWGYSRIQSKDAGANDTYQVNSEEASEARDSGTKNAIDSEDTPSMQIKNTSDGNSVSVSNQPEGMKVFVGPVSVKQSSWVVVRKTKEDGSRGNILGAQRFDEGTWKDGVVTLLRNTVSGSTYQVSLQADNGNGVFDIHADKEIPNTMDTFTATSQR